MGREIRFVGGDFNTYDLTTGSENLPMGVAVEEGGIGHHLDVILLTLPPQRVPITERLALLGRKRETRTSRLP